MSTETKLVRFDWANVLKNGIIIKLMPHDDLILETKPEDTYDGRDSYD